MRIAIEGELTALLARASDDEVEVMLEILRRVDMARGQYGPLRLRTDGRNFVREALAESVDQTFYLAAEVVRGRHLR